MRRSAWDDLREDARTFARQNPRTGHTLVYVPDRSAEGVAAIDVDAGGAGDVAAMLARAFDTGRPLRELGVGGIESHIRHRTQRALGDGGGFVAEWLWSDPVGGTIHPNEESGQVWPRLCDALWQLIVHRVETIVPGSLEAADLDAPAIGKEPNTSDAARLLHWLAWSGQVEGLRANVGWRLCFRPTDDSQLAKFATFPRTLTQASPFDAGRPERPGPILNKPWLHLAGWWWSTIEPAGMALVAAIDWLRNALAGQVQAGAAVGTTARGVIPDPSALPEARTPAELLQLVLDVGKRLAGMNADWWHREHFRPSPNPGGALVIIDPDGEATWHRRRAAVQYRDALRLQALRLCAGDAALPAPPPATRDAEGDITDALAKWCISSQGGVPPEPSVEHELKKLEQSTPPFAPDSGLWVKNKVAAGIEGLETGTLKDYRKHGTRNSLGTLGKDPDGRVWRRPGTPRSHPWYLRSTLKGASQSRGQNRG